MRSEKLTIGRQVPQAFETEIRKTVKINYLLYLPDDYEKAEKLPLMLFLHGAGERGSDVEAVKRHGPPKLIEEGKKFPFIIVSPQCPKDQWWSVETLDALLDAIVANYKVDTDRIYVTGLSMGGFGTWMLAQAFPDRFAAIAPICGGGDPEKAALLKDLPIWAFHGAKDNLVSPEQSQAMVDAIKKAGGNPKLTIYPEAGHDSWTETYNNPELYEWFLNHSLSHRR